MKQKVGILLCTQGTATRIVGSRVCRLEKGFAMVATPLLPSVEIERSEDYGECVIEENTESVLGETSPFFSQMIPTISASMPYVRLDDTMAENVITTALRIAKREALPAESEIFQQMNSRLITLMRLQVILEVLYEIASTKHPSTEKPSRGEQVFVGFMQSLAQHFAERRTVTSYAAEAALTVRHFSSLIRQHTGNTPMQWIHLFTVGQAKHLLMNSNLQIKEIADRLGFPEQFTFRKYFKTHTGISPSEYRKRSA